MKKGQYGDLNLNVSFNLSVNQETYFDSKTYVTCKLAALTELVSPIECFSGFYLLSIVKCFSTP